MPPTVRVAALEGSRQSVDAALQTLREAVPSLDDEAILGPVTTDAGTRALIRFDYAHGHRVAESLRASIVAEALRARKNPRTRAPTTRPKLRVRVDVPDLDL
jgi:primosomal protein N' (replication factor Y)